MFYVSCKTLQKFTYDQLYLVDDQCDLPENTALELEKQGFIKFSEGSLADSRYSAEESQRIHAEKSIASHAQSLIWVPSPIPANRVFERLEQEEIRAVEDSIPNADPRITMSFPFTEKDLMFGDIR